MRDSSSLYSTLLDLDARGYKAYKDIKGRYSFPEFTLIIDRVQGDPFASPSQLRVQVPQNFAQLPPQLYASPSREIALRDYLARRFECVAQKLSSHRGTGKSGLIAIAHLGQEVLARTAILVNEGEIEARFVVGLPARGRQILGRQAAELLCEDIPNIVRGALQYIAVDAKALQQHVETVEDADWLREELVRRNLVAFVANGAILPRRSGVDERPLKEGALPFQSPPSLQVEFDCPNRGKIAGMGIPAGVTLIVGGGYHGKSTLLRAIALGVYNRIPGDGREFVVTHPAAMKIRAEDGRSIVGTDISPFIDNLPGGSSTLNFSTTNASGSTSQAANIIEALEAGAEVLLIDEDTAATNLMIRDRRMQQLIAKDKEPITPFIDKVRQLYSDYGVSTLLVMGGSGDYFEVADIVIAMDNFQARDVTAEAKAIAKEYASERQCEGGERFGRITPRIPIASSIDPSRGNRAVKVKVRDVDEVAFGTEDIDLAAVEQLVDAGQLRAIAAALVYAKDCYIDGKRTLAEIIDRIFADLEAQGLDAIDDFPRGDLAGFRRFELAAALNRLRTLRVEKLKIKN
ncbi:ABC-ATPase domain-containing protein [Oscillatoria sp. FACHB-1406]|uniref:ABC-ATPase domain-containing protein n=1 Tax=Oscillatoria sp. FACHB-1406 TaxID=2692846 RepID=UPI001684D94E|nr:ABC-ATPase domain-containing protein [Oscillatoria sp. FACHB-1406]MBD2576276.1 ABC-ATPase domain-containing protein [Oscillatoria sp. FACHB-1406]